MNTVPMQCNAGGEIVITRFLGLDSRPTWSDVTSAGIFRIEPNGRFDKHYHDCDEYWLVFSGCAKVMVGDETFVVGQGDIICTPIGVEHDVVAVSETLEAFWFEGATEAGGRIGHLHRSDEAAAGHVVAYVQDLKRSDVAV